MRKYACSCCKQEFVGGGQVDPETEEEFCSNCYTEQAMKMDPVCVVEKVKDLSFPILIGGPTKLPENME